MKTTITLAIILTFCSLAIFIGCNSDSNKSFIEGSYVNHDGGNYSVADDTLAIEHTSANNYLIYRRTGFNLIRDGEKGRRKHETEQWQCTYDEQTGVLTETKKGKTLTFYPDKGMLMVGSREYQKLN
ncbi:hypothetical protein [Pedobacter terrae]|uniref:hypothetical protein n=1 Tax=Pedobacter terrae TaxID=405671 RepID=UPI002FF60611